MCCKEKPGSTLSFGQAVAVLKSGGKVYRKNWKVWIVLMRGCKDTSPPRMFLVNSEGTITPWRPWDDDVLAEDWIAHSDETP